MVGENSGDERHRAGPGERATVEQHASEEQDAAEETYPPEQGGEVGEAIRGAAEERDEPTRRDADEGGEVGEAIRSSTEDV
jgi:hypothetical protein